LSAKDDMGFTILLWSCRNGHEKMTSYLLEQGASKDASCSHGLQALHHACNNNREAVVRLLLEAGCPLDATDVMGNTAVHYAASRGVLNLMNQLVDAKCDTAVQNKAGQTVKTYGSNLPMSDANISIFRPVCAIAHCDSYRPNVFILGVEAINLAALLRLDYLLVANLLPLRYVAQSTLVCHVRYSTKQPLEGKLG